MYHKKNDLIENSIKIFQILSKVLVNRGIKSFILELYDLFFIDFIFQSKTFLRLNNNSTNYVPYYSFLFCGCMNSIITDIKEVSEKNTTFIDLGSGRGRISLAASQYKVKVIGVERNRILYKEFNKVIRNNHLKKKITNLKLNIFNFHIKKNKKLNLIFFYYGVSNKFFLNKLLIKYHKNLKYFKSIYFIIIPKTQLNQKIKHKVLFNAIKLNDKTRIPVVIKLIN
jgi:16S rRNA G966 N2-methylase RsmD